MCSATNLPEHSFPAHPSDQPLAVAADVYGDGHSELAVGEPNYNIKVPGDAGFDGEAVDLSSSSLEEALRNPSEPYSMIHESGCALVYSGRTKEVLFGV